MIGSLPYCNILPLILPFGMKGFMSGKKGRSGRVPRLLAHHNQKNIDTIKLNVHEAMKLYTARLLGAIRNEEETPQQAQHLVTLHMKHSPDAKPDKESDAMNVLRQMAIEGAKEFARIKAAKINDLHNNIIDAECEIVSDSSGSTGIRPNTTPQLPQEADHDQ